MTALRSHGEASAEVAEHACEAIRNLSVGNNSNRTRLGEAGASEGVWERVFAFGIDCSRIGFYHTVFLSFSNVVSAFSSYKSGFSGGTRLLGHESHRREL